MVPPLNISFGYRMCDSVGNKGLCPVVCLKANTPAYKTGTTIALLENE